MSKLSEKTVREEIEKLGGKWIDGKYENNRSDLLLECNICKKIFKRTYASIKSTQNIKCRKCTTKINREKGKCFIIDDKKINTIKEVLNEIGANWVGKEEEYVNNKSELSLICSECGEPFKKRYDVLKRGRNPKCKKCIRKDNGLKKSQNNFEEIENYVKKLGSEVVKFVTGKKRIEIHIKCTDCGKTFISKSKTDVLKRKRMHCFDCSRLYLVNTYKRHTYEYVKNFISDLGGKLLSDTYKNNAQYLDIECDKCKKPFKRTFDVINQYNSVTCSNCKEEIPKGEKIIRDLLIDNNIEFTMQKTFEDCRLVNKLKFDFYIENINTCIEFNGEQHYKPIEFFGGVEKYEHQIIIDKTKKKYCKNKNINLLIISYKDINIIKDILKNNKIIPSQAS